MSLNSHVHPFPRKCESYNNRMIWAEQLAPQGLGPFIDPVMQCDYPGGVAPYLQPEIQRGMAFADQFREAGYFWTNDCGKLTPILYQTRRDPNPVKQFGTPSIGWPYR
jgi:hypothetical protein